MAEDGYDGPAELLAVDEVVPVPVRLRGHFDPFEVLDTVPDGARETAAD